MEKQCLFPIQHTYWCKDVSKYSRQVLCSRPHTSSTPTELQVHLQTPTRCLSQRCTRQVPPLATVSVATGFCTEKEEESESGAAQPPVTMAHSQIQNCNEILWLPCCHWKTVVLEWGLLDISTKKSWQPACSRKYWSMRNQTKLKTAVLQVSCVASAEHQRQHTAFPGTIMQ